MNNEEGMKKLINHIENEPRPKHPFELFGLEVGYGWYGLVLPIINEIQKFNEKYPDSTISITQIKEKWGTLRFYILPSVEYIEGMISIAEEESEHICEICGATGKTVEINGWYETLCENHLKAKKESNYDNKLQAKLYRRAMEKYDKSSYSSSQNTKITKMRKENWFMAKIKKNGKSFKIKLEREKERTYFYIKKKNKYEKQEIYIQWEENEDKFVYDGYWYIIKNNEQMPEGIGERELQEKECVENYLI
jgi:hypothetical protein